MALHQYIHIHREGLLRLRHHLDWRHIVPSLHLLVCMLKSCSKHHFWRTYCILFLTVPQLQLCCTFIRSANSVVRLTVPQLNATCTFIYTKTYLMRPLNTNISPHECYKMRNVWYTPFIVAYVCAKTNPIVCMCALKSNFDTDNAWSWTFIWQYEMACLNFIETFKLLKLDA